MKRVLISCLMMLIGVSSASAGDIPPMYRAIGSGDQEAVVRLAADSDRRTVRVDSDSTDVPSFSR